MAIRSEKLEDRLFIQHSGHGNLGAPNFARMHQAYRAYFELIMPEDWDFEKISSYIHNEIIINPATGIALVIGSRVVFSVNSSKLLLDSFIDSMLTKNLVNTSVLIIKQPFIEDFQHFVVIEQDDGSKVKFLLENHVDYRIMLDIV